MRWLIAARCAKLCGFTFPPSLPLCRDNIKSVFVTAVVLSLAQSFVFYLFGAGFSFGAFLVLEGRVVYDDIFQ